MAKRPSPSFLIFRDQQGNWRWNFVGPQGRVIAASRVAYQQRTGCVRAIRLLQSSAKVPILQRARDLQEAAAAAGGQTVAPVGAEGEEAPLELTEVATAEDTAAAEGAEDEALTKA
jgi:uncharacterized protein YegP (UPF0339 family)